MITSCSDVQYAWRRLIVELPRLCVKAAQFKAINVHKQTAGSPSNRKMMESPIRFNSVIQRSFFLLRGDTDDKCHR